jgi:hypothetical protein
MWIFTTIGFFAVEQTSADPESGLSIYSRIYQDLERLRINYLPDAEAISGHSTNDYPFHLKVSREQFQLALTAIVADLDYDDFKRAVAEYQGDERAGIYASIWMELYRLQRGEWQ